jgi:hypothetical protein
MRALGSDHAIWRSPQTIEILFAYERMLGEAFRPVMAELSMVDAGLLVTCICRQQEAALAELVDSSCELVVKPGALRYDGHADVSFAWGEWPRVTLGLGFLCHGVEAHFRLIFGRRAVGIELAGLIFAQPLADHEENLRRFAAALGDSRLPAHH